jgi:sterol desaturase/sphingolipid hydroxylase (fatty acid hydroxylase superfamily)
LARFEHLKSPSDNQWRKLSTNRRGALVGGWFLLACLAVALAWVPLSNIPFIGQILEIFGTRISPENAVYSPLAYVILLTLVIWGELRLPARRQKILSSALMQDFWWYASNIVTYIVLVAAFVAILDEIYSHYLTFLSVSSAKEWHPLLRFSVAVLVSDFVRWFSHLLRHKVPLFWAFHAVHHSQQELNVFTVNRVHPVDSLISKLIKFIPLLAFQNTYPVVMLWALIETMYSKYYHANIATNFGWLRYFLVTPQSHRIHHSALLRHRDSNYGFTFSIWDRIFGTQSADDNIYPETGIDDPEFPHEKVGEGRAFLAVWWAQLIYPFVYLYRNYSGRA